MFFSEERIDFFKPLTSKYREQVVHCLCLLYQRQYGTSADYGHAPNREQLLETLEEALVGSVSQVIESEADLGSEPDSLQRFKSHKDHATWVLKQLLECGWIERQVDDATLQSTFPFSRMGRVFSLGIIESDSAQIRTRHRNTRNTLNALEAFVSRGEIYDLLDAFEYSERIITDFTDVIAELEERKRELIKQVESQQLVNQATDQFFDFMEKRFQPDISVRLSADSVEKHRDDIGKAVAKIRRQPKVFKQDAEKRLRVTVPDLCPENQSYLWYILDSIEKRMLSASEIMLPALRAALHGFTKRADIIIRQLSYLNSQSNDNLLEVCRELADLSETEYQKRMQKAADTMAVLNVGLVDPQNIKIIERKQKESVDSVVRQQNDIDKEAQKELAIQQLLDQAFTINNQGVRHYVKKNLREGRRISTRQLPIDSAEDLLALAHVIEVGAVNSVSSDWRFNVSFANQSVDDTEYYHMYDEFYIELIDCDKTS